jgi:thymidylate synthase
MNKLDKQYTDLLQDILDNGVRKEDRTGTGTISVFGRQIRHDMKDGFPLLTTKKMPFKTIVTELLWFLRGDTNIKYLVDNGCNIWNGDAYKNYESNWLKENPPMAGPYTDPCLTQEEFINNIKEDDEFAKKWGQLGPIYGKQWREWKQKDILEWGYKEGEVKIDQIQNLINNLKTNPDSRRLMVNAWNVGELDQMVLPPCHYGFQVYTRPLSFDERYKLYTGSDKTWEEGGGNSYGKITGLDMMDDGNVPTRAISLMWNQRSVDTFLGLPFNIASYGLLLEIIAKEVNMVPDQLIGNLGDVHLYSNHIDAAKEQIGRDLTLEERFKLAGNQYPPGGLPNQAIYFMDEKGIAKRTREPFPLPTLSINTEFWQTESGECGVGPLNTNLTGFEISDFIIENYQSHPTIKAPLSN